MRVSGCRLGSSVARMYARLTMVILIAAVCGGNFATAHQNDPTPSPEVPNVPAEAEVVLSVELVLDAGDYQWHAFTIGSSLPGDTLTTVHQGLLVATSGEVQVSYEDDRMEQVERGEALFLVEGDKILPISSSGGLVEFSLVELLQISPPATPVSTETAGFADSMTIGEGHYIVALLFLPESVENEAMIEAIAAMAEGLIIEIMPPDQGATPEATDRARWFVGLFPLSATGNGTGSNSSPTGLDTPTPTATGTVTPTSTASSTTTPTASATATNPTTLPTATATTAPGGLGSGDGVPIQKDGPSLGDGVQIQATQPALLKDTDGDGLDDFEEETYGTSASKWDTDGDGLGDGAEVANFGTDPLDVDTDSDTLSDWEDLYLSYTDPLNPDSDNDLLWDNLEYEHLFSDPNNRDTDGDCLNDGFEVLTLDTLATYHDTDGDGVSDSSEYGKSDPLDPNDTYEGRGWQCVE